MTEYPVPFVNLTPKKRFKLMFRRGQWYCTIVLDKYGARQWNLFENGEWKVKFCTA